MAKTGFRLFACNHRAKALPLPASKRCFHKQITENKAAIHRLTDYGFKILCKNYNVKEPLSVTNLDFDQVPDFERLN
jgi:hypothetical protein